MKNKELAFDYLHSFFYKDLNTAELVLSDDQLEVEEKELLKNMMDMVKVNLNKAQLFDEMQTESNKQVLEAETQSAIKAHELNTVNIKNTFETIMGIKNALQELVKDARKAYNYIMAMYITAFVIGILLIGVSVYFAAKGETVMAIVFGGVGFLDLVTTFFFKPPMEIQNSRSNLTQLMIIITNWFADLVNMNSYIGHKGQNITLEEMTQISNHLSDNTKKMIQLIEEYGENNK